MTLLEIGSSFLDFTVQEVLRQSRVVTTYRLAPRGEQGAALLKLFSPKAMPVKTLPVFAGIGPRLSKAACSSLVLPLRTGLHEGPEGQQVYVLRPFVAGREIFQVHVPGQVHDPEILTSVAASLLRALAPAHSQFLAVKNLKPANVLLTPSGEIKLLDQGVTLDDPDRPENRAYQAPEQLARKSAETAADVYAIGVMLYQLLEGSRPLAVDTAEKTLERLETNPITLRTPAPGGYSRLVEGALRAAPADRPGTANLALDLLSPDIGVPTVPEPRPVAGPAGHAAPAPAEEGNWQKSWAEEPEEKPPEPAPGAAAGAVAASPGGKPPAGPAPASRKKPVPSGKSRGPRRAGPAMALLALLAGLGGLVAFREPIIGWLNRELRTRGYGFVAANLELLLPPSHASVEGMALVPEGTAWVRNQAGKLEERRFEAFYMDLNEVTNEQFGRFVQASGYKAQGDWKRHMGPGTERMPVRGVTLADAMAFAAHHNRRLPLSIEWEYACRGTDQREYPWGEGEIRGRCQAGAGSPRPVGSFSSGVSPFGINDLLGNVWEWMMDRDGDSGLLRGGSYKSDPSGLTITRARLALPCTTSLEDFGFRTAIEARKARKR